MFHLPILNIKCYTNIETSVKRGRCKLAVKAYTTVIPDGMKSIIFAQIGVQAKSYEESAALTARIAESFKLPHGPIHVDHGQFTDNADYKNQLFMAYWNELEAYEAWLRHSEIQQWWNGGGLAANLGVYHEVAKIPTTHFETIHSIHNHNSGATHFLQLQETKEHAYWGSMRKRIPASSAERFDAQVDRIEHQKKKTRGKHLKIIPPDNICLIRSAQDWTRCSDEEKETYFSLVEPALQKFYRHLNANQEENGCLNPKFVQELDKNGSPAEKTCVVSFFLSLKHLEDWTHHHPTHIALFGAFAEMLRRHDLSVQLSLWHEVSVLQSGHLDLEYLNCHPDTGFLPYFEAKEVAHIL